FVLYRPNDDRDQIAFTIEGDPAIQGNGALAERLALGLQALRGIGFRFEREQSDEQTEMEPLSRSRQSLVAESACHVIEIRPAPLPLTGLDRGGVGFTDSAIAVEANEAALVVPSFHPFSDLQLFGSLADAVLGVPEIVRFELEFTRFDLSKD